MVLRARRARAPLSSRCGGGCRRPRRGGWHPRSRGRSLHRFDRASAPSAARALRADRPPRSGRPPQLSPGASSSRRRRALMVAADLCAVATFLHRAPTSPPGRRCVEEQPTAAGVAALPHECQVGVRLSRRDQQQVPLWERPGGARSLHEHPGRGSSGAVPARTGRHIRRARQQDGQADSIPVPGGA